MISIPDDINYTGRRENIFGTDLELETEGTSGLSIQNKEAGNNYKKVIVDYEDISALIKSLTKISNLWKLLKNVV